MTDGDTSDVPDGPELPIVPNDVHSDRSPSITALEVLVGDWDIEATFDAGYFGPDSPPVTSSGGRTSFEWLEGRHFLIQRFQIDDPDAPSGIAIIGVDGSGPLCVQHYFDSRGVTRQYHLTLQDNIWRLWRDEPGFCQRYRGSVSEDGRRIEGAWEMSRDGVDWKHDFGLKYIKT